MDLKFILITFCFVLTGVAFEDVPKRLFKAVLFFDVLFYPNELFIIQYDLESNHKSAFLL